MNLSNHTVKSLKSSSANGLSVGDREATVAKPTPPGGVASVQS